MHSLPIRIYFSCEGDWIGWISSDRIIYSTHGHYVGWLAEGPRILRKQEDGYTRPKMDIIPPFTLKISAPALSTTATHDA